MKKKNWIEFIVLAMIICLIVFLALYKNYENNLRAKRYEEIKESVKKAVERNIKAMYPSCPIAKEFREAASTGSHYNSSFLINNGYLEKSELLDIDEKSYCDAFVKVSAYYEDSSDKEHNCEMSYKIYLKCKNYEDDGYINWD